MTERVLVITKNFIEFLRYRCRIYEDYPKAKLTFVYHEEQLIGVRDSVLLLTGDYGENPVMFSNRMKQLLAEPRGVLVVHRKYE